MKNMATWLNDTKHWVLCYRATIHGLKAATFHENCDNKGSTVTIVRVGNYIFGGYSSIARGGKLLICYNRML